MANKKNIRAADMIPKVAVGKLDGGYRSMRPNWQTIRGIQHRPEPYFERGNRWRFTGYQVTEKKLILEVDGSP